MKRRTLFIVLAVVILIIVCAAIVWFYFLNTLFGFRQSSREVEQEIIEVQLEGDYKGRFEVIDQKGVQMAIPLDEKDDEGFVITDDEDSPLCVEGNDYTIRIRRLKGKSLYKNVEINENVSKKYYYSCKTFNEYNIKNLSSDIKKSRRNYEDMRIFISVFGSEYAVIEKDHYVYVVVLDDRFSKGNGYCMLTIQVYVMNRRYDHIVDINMMKSKGLNSRKYMTMEEITFIVDSLEISDY